MLAMLAMLVLVEKRWAGAEGHMLNACGLSNKEIEKVRAVMTVRTADIVQKWSCRDTKRRFINELKD